MADMDAYLYVPLVTRLENGQRVLVQIFLAPGGARPELLHAQMAFEDALGRWGVPYQLEAN